MRKPDLIAFLDPSRPLNARKTIMLNIVPRRFCLLLMIALSVSMLLSAKAAIAANDDLAQGFANPPATARPSVEVVIGSRVKLLGRRIVRHAWRHYVGRVFATGASLALGLAVYDTQCGAKLFRASDLARSVFATPFRSRWVFDVEILARYVAALGREQAAARIVELPLDTWIDVPGSKVRSWHATRAVFDLVRIALARVSGRTP